MIPPLIKASICGALSVVLGVMCAVALAASPLVCLAHTKYHFASVIITALGMFVFSLICIEKKNHYERESRK